MAVQGSATIINIEPQNRAQPYQQVIYDWTSDAGGFVKEVPAANVNEPVVGKLLRATFIPDAVSPPTGSPYDVLLKDEFGVDVLNGAGLGLSISSAVTRAPNIAGSPVATDAQPMHVNGKLQLDVSKTGGLDKKGRIVLLLTKL